MFVNKDYIVAKNYSINPELSPRTLRNTTTNRKSITHLSLKHLACNVPLPVRINFTYIPSYLWEINNTIRRRYRFLIKSGPELNGRLSGGRKKVMEAHRTGLEIFTNARLLSSTPTMCYPRRAYNMTDGRRRIRAGRGLSSTHTHAWSSVHSFGRLLSAYNWI